MTEAQRLAATLFEEADYDIHHEAKSCMQESARELRRLDAVNAQMLEALREIEAFMGADFDDLPMAKQVRAAIATTTGDAP